MERSLVSLAHLNYKTQLRIKSKSVVQVLKKVAQQLVKHRSPIVPDPEGLPCPVSSVKPSPLVVGYRNKDDFSIWPGCDGQRKTVGYVLGKPKEGNAFCHPPDNLLVVKQSHKKLAREFQNYLREKSPFDVCTNFSEGGHWRRFCVRSNEAGNLMGIAIMHPQQLSLKEIEEEKERLLYYLQPIAEDLSLKSFYFQACPGVRCTNEQANFQLVFGDPFLFESINNVKIRISPESFFQINKGAAEILYDTLIQEIEPSINLTIIDLFCGIGVFSCQIAPLVDHVVGVDVSVSAITDAKFHSEVNSLENCQFLAGLVEDHLMKITEKYHAEDLVMVVNPGVTGISSSIINVIRTMSNVKKLIYVSCKPDGKAMKNFFHLSLPFRPKDDIQGDGFIPLNAIPIDMFPQTDRVELIMTFVRHL